MPAPYDLGPAADDVAALLDGVADDHLARPTPCAEFTVRDLLGHLQGLTGAFRDAARKEDSGGAQPDRPGELLTPDWRAVITIQLAELADAWRAPAAWTGMTSAGGVEMPGALAGTVALNELVLHGWDLARATGQPFEGDPAGVAASLEFTTLANSPEWAAGRDGLFGDVVAQPADAPALHRTLGLSGRDPGWTP